MRSFFSRHLEYLLVLVLAAAALAAVVIAGDGGDPMPSPAAAGQGNEEEEEPTGDRRVPTCDEAGLTPTSTRTGTCRTTTSTITIANEDDLLRVGALGVRIRSAEALPATTPSGRQRSRMRITLNVEIENRGTGPYALVTGGHGLYVVALNQRIDADRNAVGQPGVLDITEPMNPGETRRGDLRFELSGAPTRSVQRSGRAQLGVRVAANRVGVVRLRFEGLAAGG